MSVETGLPELRRIYHPTTRDIITVANLPEADRRWTPERKAVLVLAVRHGLISLEEALSRYSLTLGEFEQFGMLYDKYGLSGLRNTCAGLYTVTVTQVPQDAEPELPDEISVGDVTINRKTRSVSVAGRGIHCTSKEFGALELLMCNLGCVVSRGMFIKHLYDDRGKKRAGSKTIDVFMCKLRKKLRGEDGPERIENIWGRGYRFVRR